jgi:hypothetical protein
VFYSAFAVCCGYFIPNRRPVNTAHSEPVEPSRPPEARYTSEPTWRIRLLTREERLHPDPARPRLTSATEIEHPYSDDQTDNPVLLQDRFAVGRFENTTGRALHVYLHDGWARIEEDPDAMRQLRELELKVLAQRRFKSERVRQHALKALDAPRYTHPAEGAFALEVEVCGSDGEVIRVPEPPQCVQFNSSPPTAAELRSGLYPTRTVQPGEQIEFKLPILGKLRDRDRGLKPGTYTVRVTVSYAEAPTGETRRVTSESVIVTVTEDDIRAAEAYRDAAKD